MREKLLDRVKKLLALARSPNENEAALAASMAAKLMAENDIVEAELEVKGEATAEEIGTHELYTTPRAVGWQCTLAMGVSESMGVKFYTARGTANGCRYMVIGPPSKVDTVKYTLGYLVRAVNDLAELAWERLDYLDRQGRKAGTFASAFRMGAAHTIYTRLKTLAYENRRVTREVATPGALMVIDRQQEAIVRYGREKLRLRTGSGSTAGRGDGLGRKLGSEAGSRVSLGGNASGAIGAGQRRLGS